MWPQLYWLPLWLLPCSLHAIVGKSSGSHHGVLKKSSGIQIAMQISVCNPHHHLMSSLSDWKPFLSCFIICWFFHHLTLGMAWGVPRSSFPKVLDLFSLLDSLRNIFYHSLAPRGPRQILWGPRKLENQVFFKNSHPCQKKFVAEILLPETFFTYPHSYIMETT